jgi:carbon-monoxide dehydrogenase iron sulfur subunit
MFKLKKKSCTYCRLCMLACTAAHESGRQSTKRARIHIEDDWPEVGAIHVCVACKEQFCIKACPEDALSWGGRVVLDQDKCTKGYECVEACPFGGVRVHPESGYPLICDTCSGGFSCVNVCPTGAIARR